MTYDLSVFAIVPRRIPLPNEGGDPPYRAPFALGSHA